MDRKNLRVIDGEKPPAPPSNRSEELPTVNGAAHGQRTHPTEPAEFLAMLFFWLIDIMRWWMPRA
jgi:hypothetical protein